ncbi:hypothetical protein ACMXYV_02845 [Neptuniibacter sp. SY11_33]|uniref:hypothetical protein n=1 Tax=Neptuniibacter sp. SY11_33 TaxID=3398215 RepID=UPI0039F5D131
MFFLKINDAILRLLSPLVPMYAHCLLFVAILFLFVRVFFSLDFTDEMQHIGEMISLAENEAFFKSDYFLQQLGYFFIYPLLKMYHYIFPDWTYFVLFNRFLLASLILMAALAVYRSVCRVGENKVAALLSAAMVICIPHSSIMSLHYNSVSIILCIFLVISWYELEKSNSNSIIQAVLLTALFFVYPVLAVAGAILISVDLLIRKEIKQLVFTGGTSLLLTVFVIWLMFGLGFIDSYKHLLESVEFTRSFEVGTKILRWDNLLQLFFVIFVTVFSFALIYWSWLRGFVVNIIFSIKDNYIFWFLGLSAFSVLLFKSSIYLHTAVFIKYLFLFAMISSAILLTDEKLRIYIVRLISAGLLFSLSYSITSGNGMFNFGLGAGAVLPTLIGIGCLAHNNILREKGKFHLLDFILLCLPIFIIVSALLHPYRESPVWKLTSQIENAPVFQGILTTPEKNELASKVIEQLGSVKQDKTIIVLGPQPWMYFTTPAQIHTPMLFMHFPDSEETLEFVARKIASAAKPDVIVIVEQLPKSIAREIQQILNAGYSCSTALLDEDLIVRYRYASTRQFPADFLVCKKG